MDPLEDPDDILRANRSREKKYVFDFAFDGSTSQVGKSGTPKLFHCVHQRHVYRLLVLELYTQTTKAQLGFYLILIILSEVPVS